MLIKEIKFKNKIKKASVYFNRRDVQIALHVEEIDWQICSNTLRYTKNYGSNSFQFYPELIENYRVLFLLYLYLYF